MQQKPFVGRTLQWTCWNLTVLFQTSELDLWEDTPGQGRDIKGRGGNTEAKEQEMNKVPYQQSLFALPALSTTK